VATLSGGFPARCPATALGLGTTAGLFDTKNAGAGKTVTFTSSVLAGADAGNYVLTGPLTTTASIAPRPVTISIAGEVRKEYDATANASLGAGQFALNGWSRTMPSAVRGPAQGIYDSPNAGSGRQVSASGAFEISGADAPNYSVDGVKLASADNIINASASGNVGIITKATLIYTAAPAVGEPGVPVTGLGGSVTGFKGSDTLATATSGTLAWQSACDAAVVAWRLCRQRHRTQRPNYNFVQAPRQCDRAGHEVQLCRRPSRNCRPRKAACRRSVPRCDGHPGGRFSAAAAAASSTDRARRPRAAPSVPHAHRFA
jgi:hypothetical protein